MINRPLNCVIVDDDPRAVKLLTQLVNKGRPQLNISGTANSVQSAVSVIERVQPDLLLLDIMLGTENSFQLLEQLNSRTFRIIFTTGHSEFAVEAFKYAAVHYLLKPIQADQFREAILRATTSDRNPDYAELIAAIHHLRERSEKKIALPMRTGTEFILQKQILYCKGSGNYTEVFLTDGEKKMISRPLGQLESSLSADYFCRVHKKYLINLNEVAFIERSKSPVLLLKTGDRIDVSGGYKANLLDQLKQKTDFIQNWKKEGNN